MTIVVILLWILGGCGVVAAVSYLRWREGVYIPTWKVAVSILFWFVFLPALLMIIRGRPTPGDGLP